MVLISVCATTIIRTTTLAASSDSPDPTWGIIPATVWSVVEANTGTICACLPTLKKPLMILFPRLFSGTSHSSPGFFDRTPTHSVYALEANHGGLNSKGSARKKSKLKNDTLTLKELDYNTWVAPSAGGKISDTKTDRTPSTESEERLTTPDATGNPPFIHTGNTILRTTDVDVKVEPPSANAHSVPATHATAAYNGRESGSSGDNSSVFNTLRTSPGKQGPGVWSSIDGNVNGRPARGAGAVGGPSPGLGAGNDSKEFIKRPTSPPHHAFHLPRSSQDTGPGR